MTLEKIQRRQMDLAVIHQAALAIREILDQLAGQISEEYDPANESAEQDCLDLVTGD